MASVRLKSIAINPDHQTRFELRGDVFQRQMESLVDHSPVLVVGTSKALVLSDRLGRLVGITAVRNLLWNHAPG